MSHAPHPANSRIACTRTAGHSPLQTLEESFLALCTAPQPLTLPAYLVCEEPEQQALPVDQVRTRLAHSATSPTLREQTWREVVRRAQQLGEPWDTVAVAMTVPVLRRMLARLACPAHLERAEIEQEALAAVASALPLVDANAVDVARELFAAADRAVHRLVHAARRRTQRETGPQAVHLGRLAQSGCQATDPGAEGGDEYTVLARAVRARVVGIDEAQLIARTRLEGEPMQRLAVERGVSARQLYRHRAAAEQHLAAYLHHQQREQ
ncbi:hypothetical protein [Streptomyces halobius]|uniref:DNA-directed RNA polymerase specialized sigma24 family protein n=1 Tax=Streptomyces halobius TaxID=2879846 RepID=A0ABY4M337_9ACTN|nr:hypothetical protein [Streptomyces halobius]UQA92181.1 hypothetical protein K9S39_10330 [Streptomyces halobius]